MLGGAACRRWQWAERLSPPPPAPTPSHTTLQARSQSGACLLDACLLHAAAPASWLFGSAGSGGGGRRAREKIRPCHTLPAGSRAQNPRAFPKPCTLAQGSHTRPPRLGLPLGMGAGAKVQRRSRGSSRVSGWAGTPPSPARRAPGHRSIRQLLGDDADCALCNAAARQAEWLLYTNRAGAWVPAGPGPPPPPASGSKGRHVLDSRHGPGGSSLCLGKSWAPWKWTIARAPLRRLWRAASPGPLTGLREKVLAQPLAQRPRSPHWHRCILLLRGPRHTGWTATWRRTLWAPSTCRPASYAPRPSLPTRNTGGK
ncbi:uncharacterized protein LOC135982612 [Chrysemys picta bellii]|uniref:uncharacterized protein LOC135982612 n=1 Tax=Chrysemys picta bellii TaxID=8478 RepID=UPI0032B17FB5